MSLSVNATNNNAYLYLQSLLQQGPQLSSTSASSDPISQLLGLTASQSSSAASPTTPATAGATTGSGSSAPQFGPETLSALISLQMNGGTAAPGQSGQSGQSLFSQLDSDGDGSISKSEFDSKFSSADQSQANALFAALDGNGDGSISQGELASAQQSQQGQGHHHHHHHMGGAGKSQGGGALDMLASTTADGAQSQTTNNADGSTSTTITYADGSTVSMTTAAAAAASSGGQSSGGSSPNPSSNLLEQLIQMQAQLLTPSASQSLATV